MKDRRLKKLSFLKGIFLTAGVLNFAVSLWIWINYNSMLTQWMHLPFQDSIYFELVLRGFLICVMTFGLGYVWVGLRPAQNRDLCLLSCIAKGGWPLLYLFFCFHYDFFQYGANPLILLWPALYDLAFLPFFIRGYRIIKRSL